MRHLMLDLETWGTRPGSAIRSIGARTFERHKLGNSFYRVIDDGSCLGAGLGVDAETKKWWSEQSEEAQAAFNVPTFSIGSAIGDFEAFFHTEGAEYVWANGAGFDPVLWESACRAVDCGVPWKYWNVRCVRTLCHLGNVNLKDMAFDGVKHNALDDCTHQIKGVQRAWEHLHA